MNEKEEIKNRLPIEELVGSYVPLKKAGRIFKANCPFHQEKTPSFSVSPERGMYKCFGCGEGGDIFDFIMKIEGLSFPEAIRLLAERTGVVLEEKQFNPAKSGNGQPEIGKTRLLQLNQYVSKLWHAILTKHPKAEPARTYLTKRGLTTESIQNFQIGYAPASQATSESLKKAEFTFEEMTAAGEPGRFQNRITFPITDITGRIVGFTGRLLENDAAKTANNGPKYWNSPETSAFSKSRTLYALHLAKQAIQEQDLTILVEGQMDVVILHQNGYTNTVASSGTALTPEQVKLLSRFSNHIAFAYDNDKAGHDATRRGIELVLAANLNPWVIPIPVGKDPAECLLQDRAAWKNAYEKRQPFMAWLIDRALAEYDANKPLTPVNKKDIAAELLPWLNKVTDSIERQDWLRFLAGRLQTEEKNLETALNRLNHTSAAPPENSGEKLSPQSSTLAEQAAALMLSFPQIYPQVKNGIFILQKSVTTPFLSLVLPLLVEARDQPNLHDYLTSKLSNEQQKEVSLTSQSILQKYDEIGLDEIQAFTEIALILHRLRSDSKESAKAQLAQQIKFAQEAGDQDKLHELFSELKNLV